MQFFYPSLKKCRNQKIRFSNLLIFFFPILFAVHCGKVYSQSVGIFGSTNLGVNNTGAKGNTSSVFDISANGKGVLIPRMTAAQISAMNPLPEAAQGLLVYQTDAPEGFYYNTSITTIPNWVLLAAGGTNWLLTGNSGTTDGTNFIGTTDNVPFNLRVNNETAGRIDPTLFNTFFGHQAGQTISSGGRNVFIGEKAGFSTTTGVRNNFIGYRAGFSSSGGSANYNQFFGYDAGYTNTSGSQNLFMGYAAGFLNSTGVNNHAVGYLAGRNNNGDNNFFEGYYSGFDNTSGSSNTFIGFQAGQTDNAANTNTTGSNNTFIGYNAGSGSPTQHTNSAAIGYHAKVDADNSMVLGGTGGYVVNVGIGTTVPTSKLHLHNSASTGLSISTNTNLGTGNDVELIFNSDLDGTPNPATIGQYNDGSLRFSGASNLVTPDMAIDDAGNVGIGTASPSAKLELKGSLKIVDGTQANGRVLTSDAGGLATWQTPSSGVSGSGTQNYVSKWNNAPGTSLGNSIIYDNGTNVGIGTSSPGLVGGSAKYLTISSGSGSPGAADNVSVELNGGSNSSNGIQNKVDFVARATDGANYNTGRIEMSNTSGSTNQGIMRFYTRDASSLAARMTILESGNTGVGITSPAAKFHISGGSGIFNSKLLRLEGDYSSLGHYQQFDFSRTADGAAVAGIRNIFDAAGQWSLDFYGTTGGTPFSTAIMRMQGDGNVGIGTSSPSEKLDVAGRIRISALSAPGISTDKLYNVGGNLFWNGTQLNASSPAWTITGNSGTVDGNNFIGTTDDVPVNFRVNNEKAGRVENDDIDGINGGNTFFGYRSGNSNVVDLAGIQGLYNTSIGFNSLSSNVNGLYNSSVGKASLYSNFNGNFNSAIGYEALFANVSGSYNTALGYGAGYNNINGGNNVFLGNQAGFNETGSNKLYIANNSADPPLIYGDFSTGQIGLGTSSPLAKFQITNGSFVANGNTGNTPISGAGTRMMWVPAKGALRAGTISGTQWNEGNIGFYSAAFGSDNTASGDYSLAFGRGQTASSSYSFSGGYIGNVSDGQATFVFAGNPMLTNGNAGVVMFGDWNSNSFTAPGGIPNKMYCRFQNGYNFYTNNNNTVGATLPAGGNAWAVISDSTKKTNFIFPDGESFLQSISKMHLGSWNYKTQEAEKYRHYGPMAQEFFSAFGHDKFGTIGCDTLINSSDATGVAFIAIQELEKRTADQQKIIESQSLQIQILNSENLLFKAESGKLKEENQKIKADMELIKQQLGIGVKAEKK